MTTPRLIDAIKQDHREIESYYDRINKSTNRDEQTQYQNIFTWELARHSIGEELVVYPALEKRVREGNILADKDRDEHQSVCVHPFIYIPMIFLTPGLIRIYRKGKRTTQGVPEPELYRLRFLPYPPSPNGRPQATHPRGRNL